MFLIWTILESGELPHQHVEWKRRWAAEARRRLPPKGMDSLLWPNQWNLCSYACLKPPSTTCGRRRTCPQDAVGVLPEVESPEYSGCWICWTAWGLKVDEWETGAQHCACPCLLQSTAPVGKGSFQSGPSRYNCSGVNASALENGTKWSWLLF